MGSSTLTTLAALFFLGATGACAISSFLKKEAYRSAADASHPIPKIIHQTWKTKTLPKSFQDWSKSWQDCLPGWELRLHTDEDNRNFIKEHFPEFLETYDGYDANIKRVDAVRYAYLAIDGGLYVDLDIECLRDPYALFTSDENGVWGNTDVTLACESSMKESCLKDGQISNAFMFAGSQRGKDFFRQIIHRLPEARHNLTLFATGPQFLSKGYRELLTANMRPDAVGTQHVQNFHTKPYSIKRLNRAPTTVTMVDDSLVFDVAWNDVDTKERCMNRTWCKEHSPHAMSVSHWVASWLPLLSTLESTKTVQHPKEDCFSPCNGAGYCNWCGQGNACCRYDFTLDKKDPAECSRALHFSMPANHVCVALQDEVQPKRAGFLQSTTLHKAEMCSCFANGLWMAQEPTDSCRMTIQRHLTNEILENGGTFRDAMWRMKERHESLDC